MPVVSVREHRFDVAAVVFDKDGTLLDLDASWGPIAEAWVTGIAGDDATVSALLCDALGLDPGTGRLRADSSFAMSPLIEIAADTRLLLDAEAWSLDRIEATPSRLHQELPWDSDAKTALDELIEAQPMLVRISAAKRLRDVAEREARRSGNQTVTATCVSQARLAFAEGHAA